MIDPSLPRRRHIAAAALLAAAVFSFSCKPFRPSLKPGGALERMEGYASLRITRGGETSRAKFAFALSLPERARLEVFDALGRSVSLFLLRGDDAYLVLPSEKVYWQAGRDEVIEKFLGFPVQPKEIMGLLSGRWAAAAEAGWTFVRDGKNRATSGKRGGLEFAILEYFPGSDLPRRWSFRHPESSGTVTLLEAAFDRPEPDFSPEFRRTFTAKTWPEIERLLR
jgi:outer membrane biogenesis lipoprotein LolB